MSFPSLTRVCSTVLNGRVEFRRLSDVERSIFGPGGVFVDLSPFVFIGRVNGGDLEMWKENGRYREDESPHPYDLALVLSHKGRGPETTQ